MEPFFLFNIERHMLIYCKKIGMNLVICDRNGFKNFCTSVMEHVLITWCDDKPHSL